MICCHFHCSITPSQSHRTNHVFSDAVTFFLPVVVVVVVVVAVEVVVVTPSLLRMMTMC